MQERQKKRAQRRNLLKTKTTFETIWFYGPRLVRILLSPFSEAVIFLYSKANPFLLPFLFQMGTAGCWFLWGMSLEWPCIASVSSFLSQSACPPFYTELLFRCWILWIEAILWSHISSYQSRGKSYCGMFNFILVFVLCFSISLDSPTASLLPMFKKTNGWYVPCKNHFTFKPASAETNFVTHIPHVSIF